MKKYDELTLKMRKNRSLYEYSNLPQKPRIHFKYASLGYNKNQRAQVQFWISPSNKTNLENHLKYIQREGAGKNQEIPDFFDDKENSNVNTEKFIQFQKNEKHHFRFMISPEHGNLINLKKYTREWMLGLQSYLGKQLQWIACEHNNTDHSHIHIVIRGIDTIQKKKFLIPKTWMVYESRKLAGEIATDILGYRTSEERKQNLEKLINKNTITMLDTGINAKQILGKSEISDLNAYQKKRLDYLVSLNLASKNKNNFFVPKKTLFELRDNAQKINIKSQIVKSLKNAQEKTEQIKINKIWQGNENITGKIIKIGKRDELSDRLFAIIKTSENINYYIPLYISSKKVGEDIEIKPLEKNKNKKNQKKRE